MDLSKYRQLYLSETQENLEKISQLLVELESKPDDRRAIDTVFRLVHSIKGMSGTMGYTPVFELAHKLEDLMDRFRRFQMPMSTAAIDVLLAGADRIGQWLGDVEAESLPLRQDAFAETLHRRIQDLLDGRFESAGPTSAPHRIALLGAAGLPPASTGAELGAEPGDVIVTAEIDPVCQDPALRGFLVHRKISELGRMRRSRPDVAELRAGNLSGPMVFVLASSLDVSQIEGYLGLIPDLKRVHVRREDPPRAATGTLPRLPSSPGLPRLPPPQAPPPAPPPDPDELTFSDDLQAATVPVSAPPPEPTFGPAPAESVDLPEGDAGAFSEFDFEDLLGNCGSSAGPVPRPPAAASAGQELAGAGTASPHAPALPDLVEFRPTVEIRLPTIAEGQEPGRRVIEPRLRPDGLRAIEPRLPPDGLRAIAPTRSTTPAPPGSHPPEDALGAGVAEDAEVEDDEAEEAEDLPAVAEAAVVRAKTARSVRVRTDWLDEVLNRTSDLLIISQRLWNLNQARPDPAMTEVLSELARHLNSLHGDALSVRMTPLSVLTARLPRAVRDMARRAGKRAALTTHGDEEPLDRAIIEGLDAPLTHLLTNAVEHGIELPKDREARGKPPVGAVRLVCLRVRDEIVVEVSDDGAGVDRRKLANRAVEMGLLGRIRADALAERDLARLLCLPGLTSRDEPGMASGRGVGLDAVREMVMTLGGHLEIASEAGAGTTVRLRLPRTPGISKLLLVEADRQVFGLPLGRVVTTEMFDATGAEADGDQVFMPYHGQRLRMVALRHLLGLAPRPAESVVPGVVCNTEEGPFLLAVDRVVGQADAVMKPLGPLLERIDGLLGVTIDAVGQPVFIVDVGRFLARRRGG